MQSLLQRRAAGRVAKRIARSNAIVAIDNDGRNESSGRRSDSQPSVKLHAASESETEGGRANAPELTYSLDSSNLLLL